MTAPGGSSPMRIGGAALLAAGVIAGIIGVATVIGDGDEGVSTAAPGTTGEASESVAPPPGGPAPGAPPPGEAPGAGPVPVPSFGDGPPPGGAAPPPGVAAPPPGVAGGDGGTGSGGTGQGGTGSGGTGSGGTGPGGTGPGTAGSGGAGSGTAGPGGAGSGATTGGKGSATGSGGSTAGRSGGASVPQAARMPLRVYNNSTIRGLATDGAQDFRAAGWTVTEIGNYSRGIIPTSTVYYRLGTAEQASAERLASEFGLRANPRFAGIEDATPGLIVILTQGYQRR